MSHDVGEKNLSRRALTAVGTGIAVGMFATRGGRVAAREATPAADVTSFGYAVVRMRPLDDPAVRDQINQAVIDEFLPVISAVDGFLGYLVADVLHDPTLTLGFTLLTDREASARSDEAVRDFVFQDEIDTHVIIEETRRWEGDILVLGLPSGATATPAVTPVDDNGLGNVITMRIYESLPDTDPREFVPEITSGFVPIISAIPGFLGYVWFPIEGGFVSISLFDTETAANDSTISGREWVAENMAAYSLGNPEVINATVVYANTPVLE